MFDFTVCLYGMQVLRIYIGIHILVYKVIVWFRTEYQSARPCGFRQEGFEKYLPYDVASESEITPFIKIDKPLVVYRFTGNVMTSIPTLRT